MEINNSPVELTLLGIDKIWVRSTNGQWIEKEMDAESTRFNHFNKNDSISKGKKSWKFWKKR